MPHGARLSLHLEMLQRQGLYLTWLPERSAMIIVCAEVPALWSLCSVLLGIIHRLLHQLSSVRTRLNWPSLEKKQQLHKS